MSLTSASDTQFLELWTGYTSLSTRSNPRELDLHAQIFLGRDILRTSLLRPSTAFNLA